MPGQRRASSGNMFGVDVSSASLRFLATLEKYVHESSVLLPGLGELARPLSRCQRRSLVVRFLKGPLNAPINSTFFSLHSFNFCPRIRFAKFLPCTTTHYDPTMMNAFKTLISLALLVSTVRAGVYVSRCSIFPDMRFDHCSCR